MLGRPFHIITNEKIQKPVAIVIEPYRRRAESEPPAEPARLRHLNKITFTGVLKKSILSDARHQNVRKSVVVVVAHRDSHPVHFQIKPRALRYVRKTSIPIVSIQPQSTSRPLVTRPVHAVNQNNVLPAVAVVVQKRA